MVINKPMPSYAVIGGYKTGCTYEGQQTTCRHCNQPVHSGKSCATAAASASSSSSPEPAPESAKKIDNQKTGPGSHTQQTLQATVKTNNALSSLSSSPPSSPRPTKQQSAIEQPRTGLGFAVVLESLSSKASYPALPPLAQMKRQHSIQQDDDQKRTRGVGDLMKCPSNELPRANNTTQRKIDLDCDGVVAR